jgi:hypothetical protein
MTPFLHPGQAMTSQTADLNLTMHRASESVWNRRGWNGSTSEQTLARWLVGVGGGVLAIEGFRRRSKVGTFLAGFGASLAWWAVAGPETALVARGRVASLFARGGRRMDRVLDESADSFPASDAPSWTPTTGTGVRARAHTH